MKRIELDTGVARQLCYSEPPWFSAFVEMAGHGWSFHLTEIAVSELIAALYRGSISEEQWKEGIMRLEVILGKIFPTLPGKRDLFHLCGLIDEEDPNKEFLSEEFLAAYSIAMWEVMKTPLPEPNVEIRIFFRAEGKTFSAPFRPEQASIELTRERSKWIEEMTQEPITNFDYEKSVINSKRNFDSWAKTDGLPMSLKGDILAHARAEWERRLANGYNASSGKRKNDGIDFLLNFTFMWPALLVTTDQNLRNFIRGLKSYQAGWIFFPQELASVWIAGNLAEPDWST
ncbi:hypothetical protein HNR46_000897 [Haloferula luteola]|uniref:Uncharacterized protein n=1 Tax=Haloferula luteola TaxID=595692 RepID=A0A840VA60_9BACT|nr:hypothetical protein [Haloferula luteola]MBB5350669.1 hypothetical protein [Haloferula luteola]